MIINSWMKFSSVVSPTKLKGTAFLKECGYFCSVICLKYILEAKMETAELPINNYRLVQDWHKSLLFSSITQIIKLNTVFTSGLLYFCKVTIILSLTPMK
jgi:hypothetical protein